MTFIFCDFIASGRRGNCKGVVTELPKDRSNNVSLAQGDAHEVVFFRRHIDDDAQQAEPGRHALNSWPTSVRAKARAVLGAVAAAPPSRFSGGGYWESLSGDMNGWFEIRINGAKRHHYRLFCLLDYEAIGVTSLLLVIVDGRDKPFNTRLKRSDYQQVRELGEEYWSRNPRSIV